MPLTQTREEQEGNAALPRLPTSVTRPNRAWHTRLGLGYLTQIVQFAVEELCDTNSRHMSELVSFASQTLQEIREQTRLLQELVNKQSAPPVLQAHSVIQGVRFFSTLLLCAEGGLHKKALISSRCCDVCLLRLKKWTPKQSPWLRGFAWKTTVRDGISKTLRIVFCFS